MGDAGDQSRSLTAVIAAVQMSPANEGITESAIFTHPTGASLSVEDL